MLVSDTNEQEEWEDIRDEETPFLNTQLEEATASLSKSSTSKRPSSKRTIFIATKSAPKKMVAQGKARKSISPPPVVPQGRQEIESAIRQGARSGFIYIFDVLSSFFFLMKKPLAVFLVIWVLATTLNALSSQVRMVFGPLCVLPVPGMRGSWICARPAADLATKTVQGSAVPTPVRANFPAMVEIQNKQFEQLLEVGVGESGLWREMKNAQIATRDLASLVKESDLTSKDLLADYLIKFGEDAKKTARALSKLSSKLQGAITRALASNDYVLRKILTSDSYGALIVDYVWPFGNNRTDVLTKLFTESLEVLSDSLEELMKQAEICLGWLNDLEEQLQAIKDMLTREDKDLTAAHADVLAALWTKLGANRGTLRNFEKNLELLRELGGYRSKALVVVVGAMQRLETLSADMEELRAEAARPELAGRKIPLEVQVRSIRSGAERLRVGRSNAERREVDASERIARV